MTPSHCESTCKWRLQVKATREEVSRYPLGYSSVWAQSKEGTDRPNNIANMADYMVGKMVFSRSS